MATLRDVESAEVLLGSLEIANTFWTRFKGLQFRRPLPEDCGLLIAPCSSIHTCFMRFAIDVTMLDADGTVVGYRKNIKPWRIALCNRSTKKVIETTAGTFRIPIGTKVEW